MQVRATASRQSKTSVIFKLIIDDKLVRKTTFGPRRYAEFRKYLESCYEGKPGVTLTITEKGSFADIANRELLRLMQERATAIQLRDEAVLRAVVRRPTWSLDAESDAHTAEQAHNAFARNHALGDIAGWDDEDDEDYDIPDLNRGRW